MSYLGSITGILKDGDNSFKRKEEVPTLLGDKKSSFLSLSLNQELTEVAYSPILLRDKKLYSEIFHLRVQAWKNSNYLGFINKDIFPNGWSDDLDAEGLQVVVFDENRKIIASTRLNIFDTPKDLPFFDSISELQLLKKTSLAYFSQMFVNKQHRKKGIYRKLDEFAFDFCQANSIQWMIAKTSVRSELMKKYLGFEILKSSDVKYHENPQTCLEDIMIKKFGN